MPDVDLEADEEKASGTLSVDCPKCGAVLSVTLTKDFGSQPWVPTCTTCGWHAGFGVKFSF